MVVIEKVCCSYTNTRMLLKKLSVHCNLQHFIDFLGNTCVCVFVFRLLLGSHQREPSARQIACQSSAWQVVCLAEGSRWWILGVISEKKDFQENPEHAENYNEN